MRSLPGKWPALAATCLALATAGCSSGAATTPALHDAPAAGVSVAVRLVVDAGTAVAGAAAARRPRYVSPSTNGTLLTVRAHAGGSIVSTSVENTSSGSPNCSGSGGSRVCTITIVVPAGQLDFTLQTYDAAPAAGAIPSAAHQLAIATLTQTIVANQGNTVTFLLQGIVSGPPGTVTTGGTPSYASVPADGATHTVGIAVSATDAAGNVITGSVPYSAPIAVALTEAGGAGHAVLLVNGTAVGASGSLAKPTDTLAVRYDGAGAAGYTTSTNIGGSTVRVSPMFVAPPSVTIVALSDSRTQAITEASAPASIAYGLSHTCTPITSSSTTGTGPSAAASFATTAAPGFTGACVVTIADNLGTRVNVPVSFAVPGPITPATPVITSGSATGSCASTLAFTGTGQAGYFDATDPGYSGALSAFSSNTSVVTVSSSGFRTYIATVGPGTATVNVSDTSGNTVACPIGVTSSSGSVQ